MKRLIGMAMLGMCLVLSSSDMSEARAGSLAQVLGIQDLIDSGSSSVVLGGGPSGVQSGTSLCGGGCPAPKLSGCDMPFFNPCGLGTSAHIDITIVIIEISASFCCPQASAFCCCTGF
ncbi:MAG: hypothetical protein KDA42_04265 [Planctomycetales bacterium]|nr:hypothetical protein [Planctomycetales bacterium]